MAQRPRGTLLVAGACLLRGHRPGRGRLLRQLPQVPGARAQRVAAAPGCGAGRLLASEGLTVRDHRCQHPLSPPARFEDELLVRQRELERMRRASMAFRQAIHRGGPTGNSCAPQGHSRLPRCRHHATQTDAHASIPGVRLMHNDMSIVRLVLDASLVVQLVMLLLLLASVASWAVIIQKRRVLRQASATADSFEKEFWSGGDLSGLYRASRCAARAAWPASSRRAFASSAGCASRTTCRPARSSRARAAPCWSHRCASPTGWSRTSPSSPRSARPAPMSACSGRSGAS
jgi:hypothetical protein